MIKRTLVVLLVVFLKVNCTTNGETFTVEIVDGVRYVHNIMGKWGDNPKVDLEFVRQIGDFDSTDENYRFFRPTGVLSDTKGNLYMVDRGNLRIQKFSPEGKFLMTIGSKGQGPGEFLSIWGSGLDENDNLYIGDVNNNAIHVFDSQGIYKKVIKPKVNWSRTAVINSQKFAVSDDLFSRSPKLMRIIDDEGTMIKEFIDEKKFAEPNARSQGNSLGMTVHEGKYLFITFHYQNRIEKYDADGNLLFRVDRQLPFEESDENAVNMVKQSDGTYFMENRFNSFSHGIQIDHKERIWLSSRKRQYTEEERSSSNKTEENILRFEIFDSYGVLLGTLEKDYFTVGILFSIIGDRMFLVDRVQEMVVREYKIVEK